MIRFVRGWLAEGPIALMSLGAVGAANLFHALAPSVPFTVWLKTLGVLAVAGSMAIYGCSLGKGGE